MDTFTETFFKNKSAASTFINHWEMENHERAIFHYLLNEIKPKISLEIGSRSGGSIQFLCSISEKVYCIDCDHEIEQRLTDKGLKNIEFHIGDSKEILKNFLSLHELPTFIHIDGDHTEKGAFQDLDTVLSITPQKTTYVLMHDTFNPEVRKGINNVDFNSKEHLSFADLDFAPGILHKRKVVKGQIWGGFSLFILDPTKRTSELDIKNEFDVTLASLIKDSIHK